MFMHAMFWAGCMPPEVLGWMKTTQVTSSGAPLPREQQGIFADNCSRYGHLEIKD